MRKFGLFVLGLCFGINVYAQQTPLSAEACVRAVDSLFQAAPSPGALSRDARFLGMLENAVRRADEAALHVLDKYAAYVYMNGMMQEVGEALSKMPLSLKQTEEGRRVVDFYNRMQEVEIGDKVPDFAFNTPEGKPESLYAFLKGKKVVLIDFWASWCGPCRQEAKFVRKIYDEFHAKGFDVFGVSLDTKLEAWKQAIGEDDIVWAQVSDLKGWKSPACKWFNFNAIPCFFLVDGDGVILARDLKGEALRQKVAELCR